MKIIYRIFLLYPYWLLKILFHCSFHFFKTIFFFHINEKKLDHLSGIEFERLVSRILKKSGYHHVTFTKNSNDYGIDILARKNHLSYGFQCKRYQKNIGVAAIAQTKAGQSYYNLDSVTVITNSYFTHQAITLAQCNDISLIDRNQLLKMIKKTKTGFHCIPFYTYLVVLMFIILNSYLWFLTNFLFNLYILTGFGILLLFMIIKTIYYSIYQQKENYHIQHYNDK